jgi:hypothetical protein
MHIPFKTLKSRKFFQKTLPYMSFKKGILLGLGEFTFKITGHRIACMGPIFLSQNKNL